MEKLKAIGVISAFIAGILIFAHFELDNWQRHQIFFGSSYMVETPSTLGLGFSDQWMEVPASGDVEAGKIHGWWVPAQAPDAPAVLFFHGNAGSISSNIRYVEMFHASGFAVLAVDYRGYGTSSAALPSESSVYADARAAWDRFVSLTPKARKRIVCGHSLGGAVAIDLATKVNGVDALIEEGSFTSLLAIARTVMPGWMPLSLMATQHFTSDEKIKTLHMPKLFIHCSGDQTIPGTMSDELYRVAPEPRMRLVISGGNHDYCPPTAPSEWNKAVAQIAAIPAP